ERFTAQVSGLTANTSYFVRAWAIQNTVNRADTIYGEVRILTTRNTTAYYQMEKSSFQTGKPSFVEMMVKVRDQNGKGVNYLDNEDFEVWEDDEFTRSTETHSYVRRIDGISTIQTSIKTVLVLDVTSSLNQAPGAINGDGITPVKEAAKGLIASKNINQEYAIITFSNDTPELIQDFTSDADMLINKINAIDRYDVGNTTILYDSYIKGLQILPSDLVSSTEIRQNFMIVFTDGNDESSKATLQQCITARSNRNVYTIGLGSVDANVLKQLASSTNNYKTLSNIDELEAAFTQTQMDILREVNSLYRLNYLSPKRGETHDLKLKITGNTNTGATGYGQATFNASNFESVQYGLYVNPYRTQGGVSTGAYGLTKGTTYAFNDNDVFQAVTYWSDAVPQYEWTTSNQGIVSIDKFDFDKVRLKLTGASGSEKITVKDAGNYNYVKDNYNATIAPANAGAFEKSFIVNSNGTISVYEGDIYTITFNTLGGVPAPDVQQINTNGKVQAPSIDPEKEDYKFGGWYYGNEKWNFDTPVTGNITLTAYWEAKPLLKVSTAIPVAITKDSVTLGGTIVVEGNGYTQRGVCYATTPDPTLSNTKKIIEGNENDFSLRAGGLAAGTTYYVRAYALNMQDTVYGNNIAFTTRSASEYYRLTGYPPVATRKPSFVDVLVSVKDNNGKGVDYLENVDFAVTENGEAISSESHSYIRKMDAIPFNIKTVLMLDNSSSIGYKDIERLKQAAVELVKIKNEKQEYAIYSFSDNAILIQDFTADVNTLVQRISQIKTGSSTTDLYNSYITGMNKLPAEYSTKDAIQKCFFVMISDGDETQHKYTTALENAALSARGAKTAYMIGLGQDLNTTRLTKLASSDANYFSVTNTSGLKSIFLQIQNDIMREANSFYNLTYLSAKRENNGTVTLRLSVNNNQNGNSDCYYQTTFVGTGFETTNAGVYLNAYQNVPDIAETTSKFGIGLPANASSTQRRDTIPGVFDLPDGFALQAVTYWADVKPQYVWTSSNPNVVTIESTDFDKGILHFTGNSEETAVITVKDISNYELIASGQGKGMDATFADFFQRSIRLKGMISAITTPSVSKLLIYPNPVKDYLYIKSEQPVERIEIFNQTGVCVFANSHFLEKLDVSTLPGGFYMVRIYIDGIPATQKIIIK
ncbi:MAG: VWA domain-containing protein, partial [Dysgonamonadaceae bacterium]|nr:VWA domain-containing protein [Dysgonamonadaceae bacterium]